MDALSLGPLLLPLPALVLAASLALALGVAGTLRRHGEPDCGNALLGAAALGLLAARAGFVLGHAASYPTVGAMLDVRDRGFDPLVGWVVGLGAAAAWAGLRPALRRALPLAAAAGASLALAGVGVLHALNPPPIALPRLVLQDLDGHPVALQALAGRPLAINLWATWCPPCRAELPRLVAAQRRGLPLLLVAEGQDRATVAAFLRAEGLQPTRVLVDPTGVLMDHYKAPGFPTTVVLGADGRLARMVVGEIASGTLEDDLAALRR